MIIIYALINKCKEKIILSLYTLLINGNIIIKEKKIYYK